MQKSIETLRTELEERLRFETILAEISANFINLPASQVDSKIEDTQRHMCELLDLDRSALWQVSEKEGRTLLLTHIHPPPGIPRSEWPDSRDIFPWTLQNVLSGKIVIISKMSDLTPEAGRDLETFQQWGTKSTVVVPLSTGGKIVGALSFSNLREERDWPETVVKGFVLLAQVFASALDRKRAEQALLESEARLNLAAESAEVRLWEMDLNTDLIWTTEMGRKFYGLAPGEELTLPRFLSLVHPEDRERIRNSIEEAQSGRDICIEYRLAVSEGNFMWITSRGRLYSDFSGKPDRLMGVSLDITERKRMEEQLRDRLMEIETLKEELEKENVYLREEVSQLFAHEEIIGQSGALRHILAQAEHVAPMDSTVLITGETGTGKELIARAIHSLSKRKDRVMVKVDCAALPATLIESELFGREKGAYTGAMTKEIGRFEMADGSTLFLDEVGELPPQLQGKLLRILQSGEFERLGSPKTIRVDVRVIAATNRNLAEEVKKGTFREDLYYRLNVFPIEMPSLRERQEDIPLLVYAFVKEFNRKMGKRIQSIPRKNMEALQRYGWPGNIRELRNIIERAVIITDGERLILEMPKSIAETPSPIRTLEEAEHQHILTALEKTRWRIKGPSGAAEILKLKPSTLYSRMEKLGIPLRRKKDDMPT